MKLTKEDVVRHVIEVLGEMSEVEGAVITLEINPIESLALQSDHGVPFALEMEDRLAIEIPLDANPFIKDSPTKCARTVGEIADFLISLSSKQEGVSK